MNAVTFFKSMWAEVKCNAALFVGYMLGNLPLDKSGLISKEHICEGMYPYSTCHQMHIQYKAQN